MVLNDCFLIPERSELLMEFIIWKCTDVKAQEICWSRSCTNENMTKLSHWGEVNPKVNKRERRKIQKKKSLIISKREIAFAKT